VWAPVLAIVVELWAGMQPIILRFYERFLTLLIGIWYWHCDDKYVSHSSYPPRGTATYRW